MVDGMPMSEPIGVEPSLDAPLFSFYAPGSSSACIAQFDQQPDGLVDDPVPLFASSKALSVERAHGDVVNLRADRSLIYPFFRHCCLFLIVLVFYVPRIERDVFP